MNDALLFNFRRDLQNFYPLYSIVFQPVLPIFYYPFSYPVYLANPVK
ncbi:hypothetical protein KSU1_C1427 [Candidatus Jettenia caeni]|uniref:Uncharacterized protein n=1 Tax=Candidatus Jettenia caeni TaxID=247490 RepID=I3IMS8_9BACT|nr:hypothetical protein KSU1_C1427 [Candidatus Jettenia caeni]